MQKEHGPGEGHHQSHPSHLQQQRSQQDRLSRTTHDQVSNIFKLISDKETSKLGLKQLHEFQQKHPEVDIQPFLRGASPFFQSFITEGLAELSQSSQNTSNNNVNQSPDKVLSGDQLRNPSGNSPVGSDYWMKKLNNYQVRGRLQSDEKQLVMDNKIADENLNVNQIPSRTVASATRKDASRIFL